MGSSCRTLATTPLPFLVNPSYVDPIDIEWISGPAAALKHIAAVASYFLSIDRNNPNAASGPSARMQRSADEARSPLQDVLEM
mmetsp:Transcript_71856/g.233554  ORF Transcript_71856/g.233554 Transcript_71856/m.233554 type:complete len:83 (+) Transcript_71856:973-1221(+)